MPHIKILPPRTDDPFEMPEMDISVITRKFLDISYTPKCPHPARLLDIYLPETGDGPFPTLVCIHGGAFWGGTKRDFQTAPYMDGLDRGFAVVSVEQRLCKLLPDGTRDPDGVFPNPVFDFKAAIRFLKANAAEYKLDPGRFALCGGSAGGYHAVMAALTANAPALYDDSLGWSDVDGSVKTVVSWFGVGDLALQSEFTEKTPMTLPDGTEIKLENYADMFLGANCREHKNLAHFANPESWIGPDMPSILLQHGDADEVVPAACSRNLAKRIETLYPGRAVYEEFPGYAHGDERFSSPENLERMFSWLEEKLF